MRQSLLTRLQDLAVFKRLHGNPAITSSNLAVKKFCITIRTNNVQATDVRPVSVLEDTLNYLLDLLKSDYHFEVVHDFIFDRTRSIRQDLTMQTVTSYQAMHMYNDGDPLSGYDQSYMVDNVLNYRPHKTAKIGAGLNYITVFQTIVGIH
ncbi:SAC3 family protein C [Forsythia ovata]|uniref:SAC3 family protein C n=1 Tax=Forsythia ovata TaxID=205694 RepID=A0ABD1TBB5_9LAMI